MSKRNFLNVQTIFLTFFRICRCLREKREMPAIRRKLIRLLSYESTNSTKN